MRGINIGATIAARRRARGVTQEELANYLGVSKPAVSKWESGQCYPDVTLLPVLASYFDISIDQLLDYQPQMTQPDIKQLYLRLAEAFACKPFAEVHAESRQYIKQYYSCWHLLFSMGLLLLNHASLAGNPEQTNAVFQEARELFQRVTQVSGDVILARQALHLQALCYIAMQQPVMAIDLLEGIVEMPISSQVLLANAYLMKGERDRAKGLLQSYIYQNIIGVFGASPILLELYADSPARMQDWLQAILAMGDAFGIAQMHPSVCFPVYLIAAQLFLMQGQRERALDSLESYVDLVCAQGFPLELHGSELFDRLDDLFSSLDLGTAAPRSETVIKASAKDCVLNNPAFQELRMEARYQRLARRLEQL